MFKKEIGILKKTNRFRKKIIFDNKIIDLASNDYLNLSTNKIILKRVYKKLKLLKSHSPKASMLVNGYSKFHKKLENKLKKIYNFSSCTLVGSGFMGNLAIFDTLVRKKDFLFIDEDFHASGRFITDSLINSVRFKHNDIDDLKIKFKDHANNFRDDGKIFIAVESIYSMSGDLLNKEIIDFAFEMDIFLIVDEAHSNGILGSKLLGIFQFYNIIPRKKDIVLGTLSKAYSSYGAYILGSKSTIDFLNSKARSIIYTTALGIFDTLLALENIKYIEKNKNKIKKNIEKKQHIIYRILGIKINSMILICPCNDVSTLFKLHGILKENNLLVGAIRPPTVKIPQIRLTLRGRAKDIKKACKIIKNYTKV